MNLKVYVIIQNYTKLFETFLYPDSLKTKKQNQSTNLEKYPEFQVKLEFRFQDFLLS